MAQEIDAVDVAPCWTLMLAFPQAMQPAFSTLAALDRLLDRG